MLFWKKIFGPKPATATSNPRARDFVNAIRYGDADRISALLKEDASLSTITCGEHKHYSGLKPLHYAVFAESYPNRRPNGDHVMQAIFAICSVDPNQRDKGGNTPLHLAIRDDNDWSTSGIVDVLLKNGADVNAKNKRGNAPLHEAATKGRASVIALLFEHGAYPNVRNKQKETPTHNLALFAGGWRAGGGELGDDLGKLFLANGASLSLRDRQGSTPMQCLSNKAKSFGGSPRTTYDFQIALLLEAFTKRGTAT